MTNLDNHTHTHKQTHRVKTLSPRYRGWAIAGDTTIIGSDNGLSPGRHQAIIWSNAGILSIGPLGTNLSENLIGIQIFSFKKMHLKMSVTWRPFVPGLNVLKMDVGWITYSATNPGYCWISARRRYLHCYRSRITTVLLQAINIYSIEFNIYSIELNLLHPSYERQPVTIYVTKHKILVR